MKVRDILVMAGELNYSLLQTVLHNLQHFQEKKLEVIIATEGGDEIVWLALIDIFSKWRKENNLMTIGLGEVCSGGIPILASGNAGQRFAFRHTMFGLHLPFLTDTVADPGVQATNQALFTALADRFINLLMEFTGKRRKFWRDLLWGKSMVWIDAKQAKKWRIIDEIL